MMGRLRLMWVMLPLLMPSKCPLSLYLFYEMHWLEAFFEELDFVSSRLFNYNIEKENSQLT
jgi:hypothetical protein